MQNLTVTPQLIQELQKFEDKKNTYMVEEDQHMEAELESQQEKSFRYYFQHPNIRLIAPCLVTILNVYQFAEDPISLSVKDCQISGFGNLYSLMFSNYPPNGLSVLKVFLWLFALVFGITVGKIVIHYWLFCRKLKLKIFTKEGQGAWLVIFFFTICVLFYQSTVYNAMLSLIDDEYDSYHCTSNLHIEYRSFMKGAAVVTWLGDFFTVWMVLDTMLQEKKYRNWLPWIRSWWSNSVTRVVLFWFMCLSFSVIMICGISTEFITWENINKDFISTNELSRSYMASVILILDLIIVMQDWDFPHFSSTTDIKLAGLFSKGFSLKIPGACSVYNRVIRIEGKWFNYGILFMIMVFDVYQWKNQIYYQPSLYGQYTDSEGYIYTITNRSFLYTSHKSLLDYDLRNQTGKIASDLKSTSKFKQYSITTRGTAFLPAIAAFFIFIYVTSKYADKESEKEMMVRDWYQSKFLKQRKTRKIQPLANNIDDDDDDDDNADTIPTIQKHNSSKVNYYFQHPALRLLVLYTSAFLSWLVIAEDPIGHSHAMAKADIIGNIYNLIFGSYPSKGEYLIFKIVTWVSGILFGLFIGKVVVHRILLNGILRLKLFKREQGSWMIMFLSTIIMLYSFSLLFNHISGLDDELAAYYITNQMEMKYTTFMKCVGLSSFFGHFIFVLMLTDTILQEKHYPSWFRPLRKLWKRKYLRVIVVWTVGVAVTIVAVVAITSDLVEYESISSHSTNELGRSCLAASVIMFDILILTQDWEFPRFKINQSIKLPGLTVSHFQVKMCCVDFHIKGKWFTYSLMGIVLFLDSYNYKNQLSYIPKDYNQAVDLNDNIISYLTPNTENKSYFENHQNQFEKLNAKFEYYNDETRYSVSLLLIVVSLFCSIVFGVYRSKEIMRAESKLRLKKMEHIPKIENIKLKQNKLNLKPLGNLRPIYST